MSTIKHGFPLLPGIILGLLACHAPLGAQETTAPWLHTLPKTPSNSRPACQFSYRATQEELSCLSNAKQVATAVLMYRADYKDVLPGKKSSYSASLKPYLPSANLFTCPQDPKGKISYTFNVQIAGLPAKSIPNPAKTVMLYEGKNGKLNFRHPKGAVVGFVDGHCALISQAQAGSLIWKVNSAPPGKKTASGPHQM